jgi:hypothetical protein
MRPSSVTQTGIGVSPGIPVDIYCPSSNKGVAIDMTGTNTVSVQITMDDVFDPAVVPLWLDCGVTNLVGATTDQQGTIVTPCRAIRLNQTAGTGSTKLTVVQQSLA